MPKSTEPYEVGNPRGVPKNMRILAVGDKEWYEGDDFIPPPTLQPGTVDALIEKGFLKVKRRG